MRKQSDAEFAGNRLLRMVIIDKYTGCINKKQSPRKNSISPEL